MLLQVSMSLSETLARLTMNLNRRPDLTRRLRVVDDDNRKSVAESSAEIIQKIFTTCLTDRTGTRTSKPEGKRVGVYMFANLVLKLLFAVCLSLLHSLSAFPYFQGAATYRVMCYNLYHHRISNYNFTP
jgi:hypothetical protein